MYKNKLAAKLKTFYTFIKNTKENKTWIDLAWQIACICSVVLILAGEEVTVTQTFAALV